ncbi:hypothetical protein H4S08_004739 [Coemansia sp. RSA 1365]|nr:hypothetical protein H4S08_004739 [Coemansia sp. RSA 1365]
MTNATPKKKLSRRSGKLSDPLRASSSESRDNLSTLDVSSVHEVPETQFLDAEPGPDRNKELDNERPEEDDEEEPDPIYQQVNELEEGVWELRNSMHDLKNIQHERTYCVDELEECYEAKHQELTRTVQDLTAAMNAGFEKLLLEKSANRNSTPINQPPTRILSLGDDSPPIDLNPAATYTQEMLSEQEMNPAVEPLRPAPTRSGENRRGSGNMRGLDYRDFRMSQRDWVAHLEEEGRTATFNPVDGVGFPRPPVVATSTQIRLPTGLPTFGRKENTDVTDVIDYACNMEVQLFAANLDIDDFGCRAVTATVNPRLAQQLLHHVTYKGRRATWRTTVYWLLKLAPRAMSETEAQTLLEEIRLHAYDNTADFVSAFEALRFRAGPRLGKENATELLFQAIGKTHAMYILQSTQSTRTRPADIWELEDALIYAQTQEWLTADDEVLARKQQQRMARMRRQYRIPQKSTGKEYRTNDFTERVRPQQQQKPQNRSGLFTKRREYRSEPAVKQVDLQEHEETEDEI